MESIYFLFVTCTHNRIHCSANRQTQAIAHNSRQYVNDREPHETTQLGWLISQKEYDAAKAHAEHHQDRCGDQSGGDKVCAQFVPLIVRFAANDALFGGN